MSHRHLLQAITLVNAAADGTGDEEVTPAEIAAETRLALAEALRGDCQAAAVTLREALDALSDGMPADHVAGLLYTSLARSRSQGGDPRHPS